MNLTAHNITNSISNRLRSPRLVIIEFVLDELSGIGSAGQMLYLSLFPNYVKKGDLHHEKISFDLKNEQATSVHIASMPKRVRALKKLCVFFVLPLVHKFITLINRNTFDHAVVIIHTHSDDTAGTLFYTSNSEEGGTPLSTGIKSVGFIIDACASPETDEPSIVFSGHRWW